MDKQVFEALSAATLPEKLGGNTVLREKIGPDFSRWSVKEVGDGNLNLVFIVSATGALPSSSRRCPMCALSAKAGRCR